MAQLHSLPTPADAEPASGAGASVVAMEPSRCSLCGASLKGNRLKFHMISPRSAGVTVTVCSTCRRAAISEGYRPAD
jgi:predicted RNA-binding Zn-ribbon protein involved in translation (DUF1610 family)